MSMLGFTPEDMMSLGQSLLDPTLARPVKVFVDKKDGRIWRIIDPMSPTENMPVVKEWTKEEKKKRVIEGKVTEYYEEETETVEVERVKIIDLLHIVEDAHHHFDEAGVIADGRVPSDRQTIANTLNSPANSRAKVLILGHADRCHISGYVQPLSRDTGVLIPTPLNRSYNHDLSSNRADAVRKTYLADNVALTSRRDFGSGAGPRHQRIGCSNYCPISPPNANERVPQAPGNAVNRRTELYILPDPASCEQAINDDPQMQQMRTEANGRGAGWVNVYPCLNGTTACNVLSTNPDGTPYKPPGSLETCRFYERLKQLVGQDLQVDEGTEQQTRTRKVKKVKKEKDKVVEETHVTGAYEPPEGEHYGFNMRKLLGRGTPTAAVAPEVMVAPNREEDAEDYNLIKPGPIRLVKLDVGFWGDERKRDSGRPAGFHRKPARWFGAIEGPFVFLCFFETPDSVDRPGSFSPKMPDLDEKLNPLMHRFCRKAMDLGFSVRIEKKAVGEAGPDAKNLYLFFGDMHLPRKYNQKDADYETQDKCVMATQMLKSILLDSLRKDYLLSGARTPWLSAHDRLKCLEFFEHGAEKLKLPMYSSGRVMSNPFTPDGDGFLEKLGDVAQKSIQTLQQIGYYLFEFTQDDLRREVTRFGGMYKDRGRGFTKDGLSAWFYGFDSDRQVFDGPAPTGPNWKKHLPGSVSELGERFGIIEPDESGRPPENLNTIINPAPARDLLRILKVARESNSEHNNYIKVVHTGDMYEMWINRRYLFLDMGETDDPKSQKPDLIGKIEFGKQGSAMGILSGGIQWVFRTLLGGINAQEFDIWHRRECRKESARPTGMSEGESTANLDPNQPIVGTAQSPVGVGGGLALPGVSVTSPLEQKVEPPVSLDKLRGAGYVVAEAAARRRLIGAFEAPIKDGEDRELLGEHTRGNLGLWNKAVIAAFKDIRAEELYGNHDCYQGLMGGNARPYLSDDMLWAEHAHRFEDSNIDGQIFGSSITNMVYDMLEVPLYEGLLDEYYLHREQDLFQPGVSQWFLLAEFAQDLIKQQQEERGTNQKVEKFRIAVNGHTHAADLAVMEFVFAPKENTALGWITHAGAIAKLLASLTTKIIEWYDKYKDREDSWGDWWNEVVQPSLDKAGDVAKRPVDKAEAFGAGMSQCLQQAGDFAKKWATDKLKDEWDRTKDVAGQNVDAARDAARQVEERTRQALDRGRQATDGARDTFGF